MVEYIVVGDKFCVCMGEKVLVDGMVLEGCLVVDELMIIGELMLVMKELGVKFIVGIIN